MKPSTKFKEKIAEAYSAEPSVPSARGVKQLVREFCRETATGEKVSYAEYSDGATDYNVSRLKIEVGGNNHRISHDHWYNLE